MSNTEALFTRFEGLFREYLQRPLIVGFGLAVSLRLEPTKRDLLRQFFDSSWKKKDHPSKQLLMEVVGFIGPPPIGGFEDVEDHVAKSFAAAIEKLEIEEHNEEASLPQKSHQKVKPGKSADPKIKKRGEIVRKHIHKRSDFFDEAKKQALLREFEENEIPLLKDSEGTPKHIGISEWADYIQKPHLWEAVVDDILNRDRFPRKSKITTE